MNIRPGKQSTNEGISVIPGEELNGEFGSKLIRGLELRWSGRKLKKELLKGGEGKNFEKSVKLLI